MKMFALIIILVLLSITQMSAHGAFGEEIKSLHGTTISLNQVMCDDADCKLSQAEKFSAFLLLEISSDPFLMEVDEDNVCYPTGAVTYHIHHHNKLSAFSGIRRGGSPCTSSVCDDVLDFEGIELRLTTRF